jgi:hypothetical protein
MAASEELDLELIAAFIDGRLSRIQRNRAIELLRESEAAFEVYADALRARADVVGESEVSLAVHRTRSGRRWWVVAMPLAAAAALAIAVLPTLQSRRQDAMLALSSDSILEPLMVPSVARPLTASPSDTLVTRPRELAMALGAGWEEHGWRVNRGGGSSLVESSVALRLGVRATDLRVALAVGDRGLSARMAADIEDLLGSVNLSDGSRADYRGIRTQLAAGDSIDRVVGAALRAEETLGGFLDSEWFGLGRWFGAGELAALAHSASFFASRETTEFLDSAIERGRLAPEDADLLRQIAALAKGGVSDEEFKPVQEKFAELIRRHGG